MPVFRCFTERHAGFDIEADKLLAELNESYGIKLASLRIFNRYDVENVERDVFIKACETIMSEPQTVRWYEDELLVSGCEFVFAVEALPGQYDQRADSCAQCIQIMTRSERPEVAVAKVYAFDGKVGEAAREKIKAHLINPVEAREELLKTLAENGQIVFQYVDANGTPTMDISANPNGSAMAIEGIISPDGRILGKMGHSERVGAFVAKNIPFTKYQPLFEGGVKYFTD